MGLWLGLGLRLGLGLGFGYGSGCRFGFGFRLVGCRCGRAGLGSRPVLGSHLRPGGWIKARWLISPGVLGTSHGLLVM